MNLMIVIVFTLNSISMTIGELQGYRIEKYSSSSRLEFDNNLIPMLREDEKASLRLMGDVSSYVAVALTEHTSSCNFLISNSESEVIKGGEGIAFTEITVPKSLKCEARIYFCMSDGKIWHHQGNENHLSFITYRKIIPDWIVAFVFPVFIFMSGLCSGMTVGLLSLDVTELEILNKAGTRRQQNYAHKILPIRKRTNFLLVTLSLGNVIFDTAFTLLTDSYLQSWYTIVIVTSVLLVFTDILPAAIFTRYALVTGANLIWFPYTLMYISFPISYPLGKFLDWLLGQDMTTYTKAQLKEVLEITDVPKQERDIIAGALEMHTKKVEEVMTRIEDIYMISSKAYLDYPTIAGIMGSGYSRIPVYEGERSNILAILFTKDLALLDPEDRIPVKALLKLSKIENLYIEVGTTLDSAFNTFKEDPLKRHLAFIYDPLEETNDGSKCILGLVTLEDIIEELVQFEIVDEFDIIIDNRSKRKREKSMWVSNFMSVFGRPTENKADFINSQIRIATFQFLASTVDKFHPDIISMKVLKRILKRDVIFRYDPRNKSESQDIFDQDANDDSFVMILEGRIEISIGKEKIKCESGPFFYFGLSNLDTEIDLNTHSDYKITPLGEVHYLRIPRDLYFAALRATEFEKTGQIPDLQHEPYPDLFYDDDDLEIFAKPSVSA
ncbi:hypothetical protein O3M35_006405 [Rhynocoris fuscipes]|uniref:Uncharacterized protein n=1 Tax=Rhynocoris fuscipes TaxID=488301 RepID=A0AAW1DL19_9HEMI